MLWQIAPGMVTQSQSACRSCQGKGHIIPPEARCKTCNGEKVVNDSTVLQVHIDKGMRDGHPIKFNGAGSHMPDTKAGDIVIVVDEAEHPVSSLLFVRSGWCQVLR